MKILYVENNDDNICGLENRPTRAGFTVMIARDGVQGVAMASAEQPHLAARRIASIDRRIRLYGLLPYDH